MEGRGGRGWFGKRLSIMFQHCKVFMYESYLLRCPFTAQKLSSRYARCLIHILLQSSHLCERKLIS